MDRVSKSVGFYRSIKITVLPADVTINKTIPSKPVLMMCDIWSECGSIRASKLLVGRWLYA